MPCGVRMTDALPLPSFLHPTCLFFLLLSSLRLWTSLATWEIRLATLQLKPRIQCWCFIGLCLSSPLSHTNTYTRTHSTPLQEITMTVLCQETTATTTAGGTYKNRCFTCRFTPPSYPPPTCFSYLRLSSEGETERVSRKLVEPLNLDKIIFLFCTAQQVEFEDVVDKLHLMMDKSLVLVKVSKQTKSHPIRCDVTRSIVVSSCLFAFFYFALTLVSTLGLAFAFGFRLRLFLCFVFSCVGTLPFVLSRRLAFACCCL